MYECTLGYAATRANILKSLHEKTVTTAHGALEEAVLREVLMVGFVAWSLGSIFPP